MQVINSRLTDNLMSFLGFYRLKDYKRLNRYLINIHKASDLDEITTELSLCIKEIFDHEFFALAVKTDNGMMAWVEPSVFKGTILPIIKEDFGENNPNIDVYPINISNHGIIKENNIKENLFGKEFRGENFTAKLYILPGRRFFLKYHEDIIENLIIGLQNAISGQVSLNLLKEAAIKDPLTSCYNRRELERQMEKEISISRRFSKNFSVIMFDIDHFKKVNDQFGHQAGDTVLKTIASYVKSEIRMEDDLFRYGGEEFILILRETDIQDAGSLAERLRYKIESNAVWHSKAEISVTASFGVAAYKKDISSDELVRRADAMLYKAKNSGRNKVVTGVMKVIKSTNT